MLPKLKRYDKKFTHTYAYGTFPVIDMLKLKKEFVHEVILNSEGESEGGVKEIIELCKASNIKYFFDNHLIEKLSIKENTYAVGVFEKYLSQIETHNNHVILVNPSNMGNIGTIVRTMAGFNMKNLALISPAADVFDPKVIRSSMGALFSINFQYFKDIEEYKAKFKNNLYSFVLNGDKEISEVQYEKPFSLIFGNEGAGLPEKYKNFSNTVFIKHADSIDSLNLSICAGIALYKFYSSN